MTTCAAAANAASAASALPWRVSAGDVAGRAGHTSGAPGAIASASVDDHRQRLVVDVDRLRRIARLLARFGDDRGDRFADEANGADGQRMLRRRGGRRAVARA